MAQMYDVAHNPDADPCIPQFYTKARRVVNPDGEVSFVDIERVRIINPSDKTSEPVHDVTDYHRNRWPRQYNQFKSGQEQKMEGIPLTEFAPAKPSEIALFAKHHIHTVEQLASVADEAVKKIPNGYALQKKAREFLDARTDTAKVSKLQFENENLHRQVDTLSDTLEQLKARLDAISAKEEVEKDAAPRKRGRPKKVADDAA